MRLIMLVFASIMLLSISADKAFAMGQAPSTCNNRYDGPITSMTITNGNQAYDPIRNPGITFQVDNDKSYAVSFTIHTSDKSSQGNSLQGSTWYDTSAPGYWMGFCVSGANPSQDIIITQNLEHSGSIAPQTTQTVSWHTFASDSITYNVKWVNPKTDATPGAPSNLLAKSVSPSKISLRWTAPTNNGEPPVIGYKIERSTDGGATWITIKQNTGNTSTAYSDAGLSPRTYTYRVYAINSVGTSEPSNMSSATTPTLGLVAKIKISAQTLQIKLDH